MENVIKFVNDNTEIVLTLLGCLYELLIRIYPTGKSYSIITFVYKAISFLVPDRRKNTLPIILLFVLASLASFAQTNSTFKSARSYNADSTTVRTEVAALESLYSDVGAMYYNVVTKKWRVYYNHGWHDLISSGSGGGGVSSVTGTINRITSSGGSTPQIDIDPNWIGQNTITTLGTIATGVWNATTIPTTKGGTGLTSIGSPLQVLRTNSLGNGLEYATLNTVSFGTSKQLPFMNTTNNDFIYDSELQYDVTNHYLFSDNGTNTSYYKFFSDATSSEARINANQGANGIAQLSAQSSGNAGVVELAASGATAGSTLNISQTNVLVTGSYTDFPGITYNADYSADYTSRSLIDLGYFNANAVSASVLPFVTPEQYGAVGNGSTDDAAALQNAINSGKPVFLGQKNYRVNSTLTTTTSTRIFGSGWGSIISTASNIPIITLGGINGTFSDFKLLGNDTGAAQFGMTAVGNGSFTIYLYTTEVTNVLFQDLTVGVYGINTIGNNGGTEHQGTYHMVNCVARSCATGWLMDTRCEYNTFTNCSADNCTTGVRFNGGNNRWIGGNVTDNTTGFYIGSGTNDGHGVIDGVAMNHNTTNITAVSTANGFLISDCDMYGGNVVLNASVDIKIEDCVLSTVSLSFTSTTNSMFEDNLFMTDPSVSFISGATSQLNDLTNYFKTGTIPASFVHSLQSTSTFQFLSGQLQIRNPANTFGYNITGGAVTSTNNVGFPVISSNETFVLSQTTQTLLNKTLGSGTAWTVSPTITDGLRITFNPNGTNAGINVGTDAADPSAATNADIWYNTTGNNLSARINNQTLSLMGAFEGSATLDFPSTTAGCSTALTITATGAADGDPVDLGSPNGSLTAGGWFFAWVSSANTVSVKFCTFGTTEDPASGTFKVKVTPQ